MSAKKKAKGKAARSAKPVKAKKGPAQTKSAKAGAGKGRIAAGAKKRSAPSRAKGKPIAKKVAAKKPAAKKLAKKLVAKKPAAKKQLVAKKTIVAKKAAPVSKPNGKPAIKRRDATGHLDPAYAADLRARIEEGHPKDDNRAFAKDALSDELGEESVVRSR